MTGRPCGQIAPAVEVAGPGQVPTGFFRGACGCTWVSPMARASEAEAEADAQAHRAETSNGQPPALTGALAAWAGLAGEVLGQVATSFGPARGLGPADAGSAILAAFPALGDLIGTGHAWIITAHEHERRAAAYQSGGDALTAALRGRLDAAWEILTAAETAGRTVPASALREALEGLTPEPPGRPVTGGGPGNSTEGNRNDGEQPG